MKNKCPVKGKIAYLAGLTPRAESAIFGSGCGSFGALEQHPPGLFVRSVEEAAQGLVLCRIKLPQGKLPLLAREYPANEHNLDYVDKLELCWGTLQKTKNFLRFHQDPSMSSSSNE